MPTIPITAAKEGDNFTNKQMKIRNRCIKTSSDISKILLSLSMVGKESVVLMSIHDDVELELNLKYADRRRPDGWFDLSGDDLVNIYREYGK